MFTLRRRVEWRAGLWQLVSEWRKLWSCYIDWIWWVWRCIHKYADYVQNKEIKGKGIMHSNKKYPGACLIYCSIFTSYCKFTSERIMLRLCYASNIRQACIFKIAHEHAVPFMRHSNRYAVPRYACRWLSHLVVMIRVIIRRI